MIAAFDVGGTKIAGALFDGDGILCRSTHATPGPPGASDPGSQVFRALAEDLARRAAGAVTAVGVGFCEYVERGRLTSREVIAWEEQPADWLAVVFPGAAVSVESDVRCGLLAELQRGLSAASVLYVSWGTGLSSALAIGGHVWPGARGRAIALGELLVPGAASLEAYASGAGMTARYADLSGAVGTTAQQILRAADDGDDLAALVADSAGASLADALAGLAHVLDPDAVVLGGGLGVASGSRAARALRSRWAARHLVTPLVPSALGADGPLIGAALVGGWRFRPAGGTRVS
jgi:glucokinase